MAHQTSPDTSKALAYFDNSLPRVFRALEIADLQIKHGEDWRVPAKMGREAFREWLLKNTPLTEVKLKCHSYPALIRYAWTRDVPAVSIALSIRRSSYCCHGTAFWIHGLGGKADEIFVNAEQSDKLNDAGALTQDAIDRAFRNRQRTSNLVYLVNDAKITVLSGKQTGRLAVESQKAPSGALVDVTSIERTLIDAAVRPAYAGGAAAVLEAFRLARGRASVGKLSNILQELDYTYPYHQAIGFYLKHADYPANDWRMFAEAGKEFDFYLCHGLKKPAFDAEWRIFFPTDLFGKLSGNSDSRTLRSL